MEAPETIPDESPRRNQQAMTSTMYSSTIRQSRPMQQSFMALCAQMGSEAAQEEQDTLPTLPPLAPRISRLHRASSTRLQERQDMLRSLPALGQRAISKQKRKNFSLDESTISSSQILIRPGKVEEVTEPAPPLGMAMEKIDLSPELPTIEAEQSSEDLESSDELNRKLLEELAAVFGLEQPEEISQVYACQIVRSSYASIIKGQLYVLQSVVCFYAYIPQRMKSGYLYKRGRQNPKYNKYWFILQGHTLSYYTDKAKPYFPRGNIDLSAATTVQMSSPVSQSGTCEFSITSGSETFSFRTESVEEMEIWVKQLGIAIYRAQHDSDTIKQLIPIYKISSIEQEAAMVGFTTVQINLQGQDVANDEYIFLVLGNDIDVKERILDLQAALLPAHPVDEELSPVIQPMHRQSVLGATKTSKGTSHKSSNPSEPIGTQQTRPALSSSDSSSSLYQRATGIAEYLKSQPGKVRSVLTTESYSYYDKMKGMWQGNKTRYEDNEETSLHSAHELDGKTINEHNERFRTHFSLPKSERLQATYYCYLSQTVQKYGKIYLAMSRICFRGLIPPFRLKMILPYRAIENVTTKKSNLTTTYSLIVTIRGQEELFFEFRDQDSRDECAALLHKMIETARSMADSSLMNPEERIRVEAAKAEHALLNRIRRSSRDHVNVVLPATAGDEANDGALIYDEYEGDNTDSPGKHPGSLRIKCLTIGSRGDVQPFIALCKGLKADGHIVTICTHAEFGPWIESHGIAFAPVAGDPAQLMRLCVEHDMFSASFFKEAWVNFRTMISEILVSAWKACQDCDLLIEAPNTMAGQHIAEALRIPIFRAFTMPWTKTRAYPHAFFVPEKKYGGTYNYMSHVMFQASYWSGVAGLVNAWRGTKLGLPPTSPALMQQERIPFLYNFSPSVVSTPLDWDSWIKITGYWFLDEGGSTYTAPQPLVDFIKKAKDDNKKIVYIGFGSIVIEDASAFTRKIVEAVVDADVRCILSKGWSNRLETNSPVSEAPLPNSIFSIDKAPHDWLFSQMDAAMHHGGAGTTGASIRAGLPVIIKPFFGDQWFFAQRVEDLGIGIRLPQIEVDTLAAALKEVTSSPRVIARAKELGEKVRSENGVQTAIDTIYRNLDYARSLIKDPVTTPASAEQLEDGWTLIDDDCEQHDLEKYGESPELGNSAFGPSFMASLDQRRFERGLEMSVADDEAEEEFA